MKLLLKIVETFFGEMTPEKALSWATAWNLKGNLLQYKNGFLSSFCYYSQIML